MSCVALDYLAEEYTAKGEARGEDRATLNSIRTLMKSLNFTGQQAIDALYIPKEDRQRYADRL